MSTLKTRTFSTIVSSLAAGMQGRLSVFLDFAVGSAFRAVSEAIAGVLLWMQGMVVTVVMKTRLSTSFGADVDSYIADFGFMQRIGAVAATGLVVFSRHTASGAAPVIPVGATVQTNDGTQRFSVYADTTNPAYSATVVAGGGYIMPAQVTSLIVPVVSVTASTTNKSGKPGKNGNVAVGAISRLATSMPGVDSVTNPAAFSNGSDEETDVAVKQRFRDGIAALARATPAAIAFGIESLQTGLQVKVLSGSNLNGDLNPGMVSVVVDDGSGAISDTLRLQAARQANAYVAAGVRIGVFKAQKATVAVQMIVNVAEGYTRQNVVAVVKATVAANINSLGLGNGLGYFNVGAWALSVPGVTSIDSLTVNGGTADIPAIPRVTLKCNGVTAT